MHARVSTGMVSPQRVLTDDECPTVRFEGTHLFVGLEQDVSHAAYLCSADILCFFKPLPQLKKNMETAFVVPIEGNKLTTVYPAAGCQKGLDKLCAPYSIGKLVGYGDFASVYMMEPPLSLVPLPSRALKVSVARRSKKSGDKKADAADDKMHLDKSKVEFEATQAAWKASQLGPETFGRFDCTSDPEHRAMAFLLLEYIPVIPDWKSKLDVTVQKSMLTQLLTKLLLFHKSGWVHGDITANNILCCEAKQDAKKNQAFRLIDFGQALPKKLQTTKPLQTVVSIAKGIEHVPTQRAWNMLLEEKLVDVKFTLNPDQKHDLDCLFLQFVHLFADMKKQELQPTLQTLSLAYAHQRDLEIDANRFLVLLGQEKAFVMYNHRFEPSEQTGDLVWIVDPPLNSTEVKQFESILKLLHFGRRASKMDY